MSAKNKTNMPFSGHGKISGRIGVLHIIGIALLGTVAYLAYLWLAPTSAVKTPADVRSPESVSSADRVAQGHLVQWPQRKDEQPAEPLSLWIRWRDLTNWTTRDDSIIEKFGTGDQIADLRFEIVLRVPDKMGFIPESACTTESRLFSDCSVVMTRIQLHRDFTDWDRHRELVNIETSNDASTSQGPASRDRYFWTKWNSATEQAEFNGWECSDSETNLWNQQSKIARYAFNSCHTTDHWWHRHFPGQFGLERHRATYICTDGCASYVLFHNRLAKVDGRTDDERPSRQFVVAAWSLLNRSQADALQPSSVRSEMNEALALRDNCVELADEARKAAQGFGEGRDGMREMEDQSPAEVKYALRTMRRSCEVAAEYARFATAELPADALDILTTTLDSLFKTSTSARSLHAPHYFAMLQALQATQQEKTPQMARTLTRMLNGGLGLSRDVSAEDRKMLVQTTRQVLRDMEGELSNYEISQLREALQNNDSNTDPAAEQDR